MIFLTLRRKQFRSDGIFGKLEDDSLGMSLITLEHAYENSDHTSYVPKIPEGIYKCVRGKHSLFRSPQKFETFEVTGVAGHSGLLFHPGNFNNDSEGCILLGTKIMKMGYGAEMIANSKLAFKEFMEFLHSVDQFSLEIIDSDAVPAYPVSGAF